MFSVKISSSLVFKVGRKNPELIPPAKPTPHEFKPLSEIDDQLRFQIPIIQFYHKNKSMEGKDPVKLIRNAISNVLVPYYPLAGRLREGPDEKLIVDCTGEGVMFTEADANVTLDQFSDTILPPCPWLGELLYNVPDSGHVLDCPLCLIQVTRFLCGGFVFAIRFNHTVMDGAGLFQFLNAIAEMARAGGGSAGASVLSVQPVWQRELLMAREPPRITCVHRQYEPFPPTQSKVCLAENPPMAYRSFLFGAQEISALRKHTGAGSYTPLEILIGCLWRCRTIAFDPHPEDEVRLICNVNARRIYKPRLPAGYYGNAFACAVAYTSAGELCQNPVEYAMELVKKLKGSVTDEYMRSLGDMFVMKGLTPVEIEMRRTYFVSDLSHARFDNIDFGWGKAVYCGPAEVGFELTPGVVSFYSRFMNEKGEAGILVPVSLPAGATMRKFEMEVGKLMES